MSKLEPLVQFGPWCYRASVGKLWLAVGNESTAITLEPRLQKLLNYFLLHPNQLLSKNQLIEDVWPASEGTDGAVMRAVGALRKLLKDNTQAPVFIATIPKKGYCWLAELVPLTSPKAVDATQKDSTQSTRATPELKTPSQSNRQFILLAVMSLLISCGILAYGLTHLTLGSHQPVLTRIEPVSALNGREQLPVWNPSQRSLLYQHQASGQTDWQWVLQAEQQMSPVYAPMMFKALGKPVWLGTAIYFNAIGQDDCGLYRQTVLPEFSTPERLTHCEQWLRAGLVQLNNQLYWLDKLPGHQSRFQLWRSQSAATEPGFVPEPLLDTPLPALEIHRLLVHDEALYVLAQVSFSQTQLIRIQPENGSWQVLRRYSKQLTELAELHGQLWLGQPQQPFKRLSPTGKARDSLGPLSADLTDLVFANQQILAVAGAKPISDLWFMQFVGAEPSWQRWFASNRSERLAALAEQQVAFVSNRSGHGQVWLARRDQLRQLTELDSEQQIQQLLWYRQQLVGLINSQLYQVDLGTGQLHSLLPQGTVISRVEVCRQQLYWTAFDQAAGWRLFRMAANSVEPLLDDVLDVRCADDGLLLRREQSAQLQLWYPQGGFTELTLTGFPQNISQDGLWLTNDKGIAWLEPHSATLHLQSWQGELQQIALPTEQTPVAIYSDRSGQHWLLQLNRQQDSDIVRLLPERSP
ncbi:winged helix-turn-helix domain-containing protein [Alkalimonas amylolytica]|uniref:DNA-binding winged helix-turn-helix (WHTH) domain-containing protein n=1 Tax=Alkalimonas amylolytica TaxID=152573 RepID=A0A1H3XGM5_ALKAM|nr:winged helix-turn-helix domain-containing protein [Alkalimonas amylolytica]SDZ97824.1 DNA-binding winged helix-turn-helix (wHTH) domain-containing protein [Alkalimonas amylolytica]